MIVEITAATEEPNGDLNLTYSVDGFQGNGMTITADRLASLQDDLGIEDWRLVEFAVLQNHKKNFKVTKLVGAIYDTEKMV